MHRNFRPRLFLSLRITIHDKINFQFNVDVYYSASKLHISFQSTENNSHNHCRSHNKASNGVSSLGNDWNLVNTENNNNNSTNDNNIINNNYNYSKHHVKDNCLSAIKFKEMPCLWQYSCIHLL